MLYQKLLIGTNPYYISVGSGSAFENHCHPELELSYCLNGSYTLVVQGRSVTVREGELAIIGSMVAHEYLNADDPACQRMTLEIGPSLLKDYFEPFARRCNYVEIFPLVSPAFDDLRQLLTDTATMYLERPPMSDLMMTGNVYNISALVLKMVFDSVQPKTSLRFSRDVGKIEKALQMIYNRYYEPLDIETVSTVCGYGKSAFCKVFKMVTGETFHSVLNRHRVEIACVYLAESSHSIEQIASDVGFSDTKNFCRVFKKIMGESAGNYRKRNR